jgi:hypothetical protein
MNHFTDQTGYNAIRSQTIWRFLANQPPGNHPFGAYFTTLAPGTPNLAARLRIPNAKLQFVFEFLDVGDLTPLPGGRGRYVFYCPTDYTVDQPRQKYCGAT